MLVPAPQTPVPPARYLLHVAAVVAVLGVLPFLWDADTGWKVLGVLVSLVFGGHAAVLLWRHLFGDAPGFTTRSTA